MARALIVLCLCVCVQIVYCQFGFFNPDERQAFNFAKGLGNFRDAIGGVLRPNRRRITNDQSGQNFQQRPVSFPTAYPEESPNFGAQGDQGSTQSPFPEGQGDIVNDGNQSQGNVNFVNDGNQSQGQQYQPGQGNINIVNNDGSSPGSYDGPNDAVTFEMYDTTQGPVVTPDTESRNNFNFDTAPVFSQPCQTVNGGTGSCVNLYSCQPFLKVIQELKSNPEATRLLRQAHCGFDGNNPKVCCPLQGIPTAKPSFTTTTTAAPTQAPTAAPKAADGDFLANLPAPPVCGVSNTTLSRVVGGVPAKLGAFPWMALLGYKRGDDTRWLCGGSLISSRHVLTAAHCIYKHEKELYVVRLGELDLARDDEGATPIDVLIKTQVKHEQYNAKAFTNDIAILVLETDVQFTALIKPICIPTAAELRARSYEDYNPIIAGWGDTEFRGPSATHLQVLQLPVVSNDFCKQAYSAYKAQQIDEKVLCAGYKNGGKDACQGDSGGPLMQPIWNADTLNTYMYQIGVVSFGKKCAEAGFPGVYSRVTHFVPWIEEKVLGFAST